MKIQDTFEVTALKEKILGRFRNFFPRSSEKESPPFVSIEKSSHHPRLDILIFEIPLPDGLEFDYIKINQRENGRTLIILLIDPAKQEILRETQENRRELPLAFHSFLL